MKIIAKRRWWYSLSTLVLLPGLVVLTVFGLKLGIDFTGGLVTEIDKQLSSNVVEQLTAEHDFKVVALTATGEGGQLISFRDEGAGGLQDRVDDWHQQLEDGGARVVRFERVGPSISGDITRNAFISIGLLSLAIVIYIAWAFRNMPPPLKSVHFGVIAVIALVHDALFVIGAFAILGWLFGIEVDAIFVTAVLTVIAFSIHDTIVVFDRVRENLQADPGGPFADIINRSINEVMVRSLNTSLVVIMVLLALMLFGGTTIRYFILALLIGMVSGTYSSIFIASPLLVTWRGWRLKRIEARAS